MSYFSGFLSWAAENNFCERIPFKLPLFPAKMERPPKPRPLTPQQVNEFLRHVPGKFRLPILLMVDAGLRVTEALTIRSEHVELDHGLLYVVGKGNKERIVPITTERLLVEIEKHKGMAGYLLINKRTCRPYGSLEKTIRNAARAAGIDHKNVTHHLLRHTFGTNATVAGYDLSALQAIMGHSSAQTTGIYQHLAGDYLRDQGKLLDKLTKDTDKKTGDKE